MKNRIKFSLLLDGVPVRSIEQLRENFNVNDIWEYYNDKTLHKWLDVRDCSDLLNELNNISEAEPDKVMVELCGVFGIDVEEDAIKAAIKMMSLKLHIDATKYSSYNPMTADSYEKVISDIIESSTNREALRQLVPFLTNSFRDFVKYDYGRLADLLWENAPVALLYLMGDENFGKSIWESIGVVSDKRFDQFMKIFKSKNSDYKGLVDTKSGSKKTTLQINDGYKCIILTRSFSHEITASDLYTGEQISKKSPDGYRFHVVENLNVTFSYDNESFYYFSLK